MSIAQHRTAGSVLVGGYAVRKMGVRRFDWRDPYYFAVALSWPQFLLSLVGLFTAIDLVFGLLYLIRPGSLANARWGATCQRLWYSQVRQLGLVL